MKIFAVILEVLPKSVEILAGAGLFVLPVSKTAAETCFIAALVCWLLLKIASKTPLFPRSAPAFFFLLFLAATLFSLIQIPPSLFPTGLKGALRWLKYLGIFCMCWDIYRSSGQRSRLFWIFLISTAVVAFDGFWQLYTGKDLFFGRPLDPGRIVRIKASLPGPTDLASFLLFAIPLSALFFFRAVSKKLRATAGFLFFFFLAAFFLTFSRAAFYALAASLLLNLFSMKKAKAAVLLSVSLAMLVFAVPSFRYNFVETFERKDITITERRAYWDVALAMIKDRPLLGVGVNTYHVRFPDYVSNAKTRQAYPHNCYLQMASEIGIPGAVFFLLGVLGVFAGSLRRAKNGDRSAAGALRIALTAFLIQAVFDTNFYALQTAFLFWVFLGILGSIASGKTLPSEK